jgi:hypothetical protein
LKPGSSVVSLVGPPDAAFARAGVAFGSHGYAPSLFIVPAASFFRFASRVQISASIRLFDTRSTGNHCG